MSELECRGNEKRTHEEKGRVRDGSIGKRRGVWRIIANFLTSAWARE